MDSFNTIANPSQIKITVKKSSFLAFAIPIETSQDAEQLLRDYRKRYYDARHVCYAYIMGAEANITKQSDNGEPSGTAGRPILGAIQAAGLTNVMVVVVRYFGGILLGTPGLIAAYKQSATEALQAAGTKTTVQLQKAVISFDYANMNAVHQLIKQHDAKVLSNTTDMRCTLQIAAPPSAMDNLLPCLKKIPQLEIL